MATIPTADPGDLGVDAQRLRRIDTLLNTYVDAGLLPGWNLMIARGGHTVHTATGGYRDLEAQTPYEVDTLLRIFSMTKPVTSVAAMMLWEEGAFQLKDPVTKFIPSFEQCRVYRDGPADAPVTDPLDRPILMWHLLTHMAGLTYGFHQSHVTDEIYRLRGYEWGSPEGMDLAAICDDWATMPLVFQPGDGWNYSVATDVLGRVVEVISGRSLDEFFRTRIFEPLQMNDTGFDVPEAERSRAASLYRPASGTQLAVPLRGSMASFDVMPFLSGGGGLWSTTPDYGRFAQMLLNKGQLDGVRLLGPRTVEYMATNHLPGNVDLEALGRGNFAETTYAGVGFGLGVSVQLDPAATKVPSSPGEFGWGGAASTAFWCDPVEDLLVVFGTQLLPSSTHSIRQQLRQLVKSALVD